MTVLDFFIDYKTHCRLRLANVYMNASLTFPRRPVYSSGLHLRGKRKLPGGQLVKTTLGVREPIGFAEFVPIGPPF